MLEDLDADVQRQYDLLNILDAKASSLLGFNAIALAAISIWLGHVPLNLLHLSLDVVFIVLLVSCASLLRIVWLRWASPDDTADTLDEVRTTRTRHYSFAWRLSIASVVVLLAVSTIHALGTAMISLDVCGDACQRLYSEDVFGTIDLDRP